MSVIRAAAALVLALALLVLAAPARACDERIDANCNAAPMQASDTDTEPNLVRTPARESRKTKREARSTHKKPNHQQVEPKTQAAVAKRQPASANPPAEVAPPLPAQPLATPSAARPLAVAKPQVAEIPSAEPVFPIELEAPPVVRPMRLASASVGQSFATDLAAEPEVAPRLSAEVTPKALELAEVSPTGAGAERRSPALQLAMQQEAERLTTVQQQASRPAETAAVDNDFSLQLGPLRTAFLAFGGLLLLGTAARLVIG